MSNHLYYGDNLAVLREEIRDDSVDLIYLDPPFNSAATYNVLFRAPSGEHSKAQIEAFDDTWHWNDAAEDAFDQVMKGPNPDVAEFLRSMRAVLKHNDMMAYLAMMAVRLLELHRVLKPTGSLYLHCDPTASHYLKLLLDATFGANMFRNEIVWQRTRTHNDSKTWSRVADCIFFYTKGERFTWNTPHSPYTEKYVADKYRFDDEDGRGIYRLDNMTSPAPRPNMTYEWLGFPPPLNGWRYETDTMQNLHDDGRIWYPTFEDGSYDFSRRPQLKRYLEEMAGGLMSSIWTDIAPLNSQARERLGYPTQKPLELLQRIISTSSNPGAVILDPFCGCGTTVHAAQKLGRTWTGIDITHLAVGLVERRLKDAFGDQIKFETHGVPKDLEGARALADKNKFEFERWAVSLIANAQPYKSKGGGDTGIDGVLYFKLGKRETGKALLSVKGGKTVNPAMVRDLKGTIEREKAVIGLFLTLAAPSKQMETEAATAGFFEHNGQKYPRLQILTIESLLTGARPLVPLVDPTAFKRAKREDPSGGRQRKLDLE